MNINDFDICPVCQRSFEEQDDVVVCPSCGTPHHRECFNSLGHCANAHKHSEGFMYVSANPEAEEPKAEESSNLKCHNCGGSVSKDDPFCKHCGARLSAGSIAEIIPPMYDSNGEKIDDQDVADIAATVKSNTPRFIRKFKENKSLSWNWCAFVFGPYYMLFRRMYKSGIITMIISLIASLVVNGAYVKQLEAFSKLISENKQYLEVFTSRSFNQEVLMSLSNEKAYQAIVPAVAIIIAVNFAIHLFCGLFADKLYRSKILKIVADVNKKLEQGDSFAQSTVMMGNQSLSQKQMKALYLGRKGGTSFMAPLFGYLILDVVTSFISKL